MQIESRIARSSEGVYSYTADSKVSASVNPIYGLEHGVETAKVGAAGDEACDICGLGVVAPEKGDVPRQTPWVVVETLVAVDGREIDGA